MPFKKWIHPLLFTLGGGAAGLLYYYFFGCRTGCPITSNPYMTSAYFAVAGMLLSSVFRKERA